MLLVLQPIERNGLVYIDDDVRGTDFRTARHINPVVVKSYSQTVGLHLKNPVLPAGHERVKLLCPNIICDFISNKFMGLRSCLYPGSPVQDFDVLVLHASFTDHWYLLSPTAQLSFHFFSWDAEDRFEAFGPEVSVALDMTQLAANCPS